MRKRSLDAIYGLAVKHEHIVFIGSDVGVGTLAEFQRDFPQRFFVEAISEAHVIGMAAGLAMEGWMPFVNTIATFLTRRCLDQIAVDLCLGNHPVRLLANGGGLVYAPLGPTHQAIEDFALMRALPNMTVVAPCDADEMERVLQASLRIPGPMYIRVGRGGENIVSDAQKPFAIGRAQELRAGSRQGGKALLLVTTGSMLQTALAVAAILEDGGTRPAIVHCPTLKPFDQAWFERKLGQFSHVATLEEHSTIGGLGSIVAECIAEGSHRPRFRKFALPDRFCDKFGNQSTLLHHFGLDASSISQALMPWMERP